MTDAAIEQAIERRLGVLGAATLPNLAVTVQEGVVTLSGTTDILLTKERAARLAESVRGVRVVLNEIVVKPSTRSDEEIRTDVIGSLEEDPATEIGKITVSVEKGVVAIEGTVQSHVERMLSVSLAKNVRGVAGVEDRMKVAPPTKRDDPEIAADVRAALGSDVWIDDRRVKVDVDQGKVRLTGEIGSAAAKSRAAAVAWVSGVAAVEADGLKVNPALADEMRGKPRPNSTSAELRATIERALQIHPRVAAGGVKVAVQGTVVTLSGAVNSLAGKHAAERIARNTRGISEVKNLLEVVIPGFVDQGDLDRRVADALARDPYLTGEDLKIRSGGMGMITLKGDVESFYQKQHAETVASRVNGVTTLINDIKTRTPAWVSFEERAEPYWEGIYNPFQPRVRDGPASAKSDREIQDEIEQELFWSPFVSAQEIKVVVNDGVATLTGGVDSAHELSAAVENAREGGAHDVRVNLHVRPLE